MTKKKKNLCGWFNLITSLWIIISEHCFNVLCLKDLKIFVPEAVIMGNAATLSCQYDLEEAALYSVRWYFEAEEFYRYVPKESPPARVFPVSGISIDLILSDSTSVTLRSVTRILSGQYHCEVSEDAPLFHTAIKAARMQVVELPREEPMIQIDKKIITAADHFKAVCTVGNSHPSANITWFINGRKVYKTPFQRILYRSYENSPTFSSLEVYPHSQTMQDIFQTVPQLQNSITILCEFSILHIYHNNLQQKIQLNLSPTTVSPNLLGLEGSKITGDPDNSPLTGLATKNIYIINYKLKIFITFLYFLHIIIYL